MKSLIVTIDWLVERGVSVEFRPTDFGTGLEVVLSREGRTVTQAAGQLYEGHNLDCCAAYQLDKLAREFLKTFKEEQLEWH